MKVLVFILVTVLSFSLPAPQRERGWRGIVPLYSTRKDVERILGVSTSDCNCVYKAAGITVHVEYAVDYCKGVIPGWNVPADTVLSLHVRSDKQQQLSELKLDMKNYTVRRDDTFTTYYANRAEGIEYAVSSDEVVNSVSYVPSSGDSALRCAGFPKQDGSLTNHHRFDEYGDLDFNSEKKRLDTFAITLDRANLDGYIVVYAGKVACINEATFRANRAKSYLINERGISPTRISAIDGGFRDKFSVELYALPQNVDPPDSVPTIAPSEVKIVKTRRCN